jgi:hypothetical protein
VLEHDPDLGVRATVLVLVIRNDTDRKARAVALAVVRGADPNLPISLRLARGRSEVRYARPSMRRRAKKCAISRVVAAEGNAPSARGG